MWEKKASFDHDFKDVIMVRGGLDRAQQLTLAAREQRKRKQEVSQSRASPKTCPQ